MNIFPIGTISATSSQGSIDSVSYSFFAPNSGCKSRKISDILITPFENKIVQTRKKNEPYLILTYYFDNIFSREYREIEHFVDFMDDSLTSFYLPDLSKGQTPSSIADSSGDWVVNLDNTKLYSILAGQKANRAFICNGKTWKEGDINAITANTSVTVNVDGLDYGSLTLSNAQLNGIIYPMYEVYFSKDPLNDFKTTGYVEETINTVGDGGYMYSGTIAFVSKYKV